MGKVWFICHKMQLYAWKPGLPSLPREECQSKKLIDPAYDGSWLFSFILFALLIGVGGVVAWFCSKAS